MVNRPFRAEIGAGAPETVCEMVSSLPPEETAQNAALIAAAPDLLEALERIVKELGASGYKGDTEEPSCIRTARAAIAKAKGGDHA